MYLSAQKWRVCDPADLPRYDGTTWLELMLDFSFATRVIVPGKNAKEKPRLFARAASNVAAICGSAVAPCARMMDGRGAKGAVRRGGVASLVPVRLRKLPGFSGNAALLCRQPVAQLLARQQQHGIGDVRHGGKLDWVPVWKNRPEQLWAPSLDINDPSHRKRKLGRRTRMETLRKWCAGWRRNGSEQPPSQRERRVRTDKPLKAQREAQRAKRKANPEANAKAQRERRQRRERKLKWAGYPVELSGPAGSATARPPGALEQRQRERNESMGAGEDQPQVAGRAPLRKRCRRPQDVVPDV